jgi:hypothetical protein
MATAVRDHVEVATKLEQSVFLQYLILHTHYRTVWVMMGEGKFYVYPSERVVSNYRCSIPTRRELVKEAVRNPSTSQLKETLREQLEHLWSTCPLSHKELLPPIVSDGAGNLYNKDAVLQFLLMGDEAEGISSKADCEEVLKGRVRGLRDVIEVKFELDKEGGKPRNEMDGRKKEHWICPVTHKTFGPNVKAVYLVPCGHAFSEEAIREMKGEKCLQVRSHPRS